MELPLPLFSLYEFPKNRMNEMLLQIETKERRQQNRDEELLTLHLYFIFKTVFFQARNTFLSLAKLCR